MGDYVCPLLHTVNLGEEECESSKYCTPRDQHWLEEAEKANVKRFAFDRGK